MDVTAKSEPFSCRRMAFLFNRKISLLNKNRSAEDRTAAIRNYVAEAPAAGGESRERDSFLFNRKIPLLNKNRSAALLAGFVLVVKISFVNKEKKEE